MQSLSFSLRVFTSKMEEGFRNYRSLICRILFFKGPKVIGQLTQKLFHGQVWAIPLLFLHQLSRLKVWSRFQVWYLHLEAVAVNPQHVVKVVLNAIETGHP